MSMTTITQGQYLWEFPDIREGEIPNTARDVEALTGVNYMNKVLPFGRGVTFDPASSGMNEKTLLMLPTAAGQLIKGVAMWTGTIAAVPGQSIDAFNDLGYPARGSADRRTASFLTEGMIAVRATEAVSIGDPVTCLITVGANHGCFGKTTNATQIACLSTWEWKTTTAAGKIGIIHLK